MIYKCKLIVFINGTRAIHSNCKNDTSRHIHLFPCGIRLRFSANETNTKEQLIRTKRVRIFKTKLLHRRSGHSGPVTHLNGW